MKNLVKLATISLVTGSLFTSFPASAQSWLDTATDVLGDVMKNQDATGAVGRAVGLSQDEIAKGLQEALRVGTEAVTAQLGASDGFLGDNAVRIPLPENLATAQSYLKKVGLGSLGDEVETRMNRAAEASMDEARVIVVDAISQMTLEDAKGILDGPEDAATQYFRRAGGERIEGKIRPIVDASLSEVGAIEAMDTMLDGYSQIPFVPDVKGDLGQHATDAAMDGLFHYLAAEEAAIRANPEKRVTELLQKVFAQ